MKRCLQRLETLFEGTTLNPNNPYFNGIMDLDNFNPHPKNPNLRKFFLALGWTDEIGSGIRNTRKYLPRYVENAAPVFIDQTMFRTIIPLVRYTMSDFADQWFRWLELDEKWRQKLTESLNNIEIDGKLHKMSWEKQITCLVPNWIEVASKLKTLKVSINNEKQLSIEEKPTKLPNKKLKYIWNLLVLSEKRIPISQPPQIKNI